MTAPMRLDAHRCDHPERLAGAVAALRPIVEELERAGPPTGPRLDAGPKRAVVTLEEGRHPPIEVEVELQNPGDPEARMVASIATIGGDGVRHAVLYATELPHRDTAECAAAVVAIARLVVDAASLPPSDDDADWAEAIAAACAHGGVERVRFVRNRSPWGPALAYGGPGVGDWIPLPPAAARIAEAGPVVVHLDVEPVHPDGWRIVAAPVIRRVGDDALASLRAVARIAAIMDRA